MTNSPGGEKADANLPTINQCNLIGPINSHLQYHVSGTIKSLLQLVISRVAICGDHYFSLYDVLLLDTLEKKVP